MSKSLLEILQESDIKMVQRGDRWVAHCPFHAGDNSPSFTVYPNMTYFCFGCRVWGDGVKFLMDYRGMPFAMALEIAGEQSRSRPAKRVIKVNNTGMIWPYLREVAERYHQFLLVTPGAVSYLHYRGLTDETISRFRLGFTDGALIDPQTEGEYFVALHAGVVTENKDHDWWETLAHRITIPNLIPNTNYCDFIMGRTVTKDKIKYLGLRIPKPLFGLQEAAENETIYLVEGHFDWLILKQWGYPAIVSGGTNIPAYNLVPLKSRRLVIVPDNDEPGLAAAQRLQARVPDSIILDYADLGVKDVGELGTRADGRTLFDQKVGEQVTWLQPTSQTTSPRWSQPSGTAAPLPLI